MDFDFGSDAIVKAMGNQKIVKKGHSELDTVTLVRSGRRQMT